MSSGPPGQPGPPGSPPRAGHPWADSLLAWYFVAVWGSGFLATKVGLQYAAPFTFLSLRYAFGLVCLVPVLLWMRPAWPRTPGELFHLLVAGLLMHAIQLGGSHYSQYLGLSAGATALILAAQPLLTAAIAWRWLGERLAPAQWTGVLVGLAGVTLLIWHKLDVRDLTLGGLQPGALPQSMQASGISAAPGGWGALFSTHPPVEQRIAALQASTPR